MLWMGGWEGSHVRCVEGCFKRYVRDGGERLPESIRLRASKLIVNNLKIK